MRLTRVTRASLPPLALAYHGIADVGLRDDPFRLFVRSSDFRRHVGRLRRWGYEFRTFGDLARSAADGDAGGLAAVTFDDGLADNLHGLVPLLEELQLPATVFVAVGLLGGMHPDAPAHRMLTAEEVRELGAACVEIGAHSMSHVDLTSVPIAVVREELVAGRRELESITGEPVTLLAYPFGRANDSTVSAARDAGYRAACMTCGEGSWSDPFRLPRQAMNNRDTRLGLRLKRSDRYETAMRAVRPLMRNRLAGRFIGATRRLRTAGESLRDRY